jgi:hypothetical protein
MWIQDVKLESFDQMAKQLYAPLNMDGQLALENTCSIFQWLGEMIDW